MRRFVPAPFLSVSLIVLWLILNQSLAIGHLLLAVALGVMVPLLTAPLRPLPVRIHRPGVVLGLIAAVAHDVVVSNLRVAWRIWHARGKPPRGTFVRIPLQLHDANGLAALAVITTVVPGTVWCELALDRNALLLHVFDVDDEATFISFYKARYERPLMEIFE
jgi:multicomponent K+:H+ antiporter subunit E